MRPVVVVVRHILIHQAFHVTLVENDHMVEQVTSATPHEALCDAVLPWALKAGPFRLNAKTLGRVENFLIEVAAVVEDQIARCRIVRKGFAQLLDYLRTRRMFCCIEVQDTPSAVLDHEEAIEYSESQCGHCKEIHRSNCFSMVIQKSCPPP